MMKKGICTIILLCCALLLQPLTAYSSPAEIHQKEKELTYKKLELFSNILSILQENYVEEINTEEVIDGAINGLLLSLDPHSSYLTPSNFQDLQNETQGNFTGIGIEITIKNGKLTIVSPIEDTPAHKVGLKANDIIVKIGEEWTKDITPMDAVNKLRGPQGTEVKISIQRKGWDELKEFTLVRDIIPIRSVRAFFLDQHIAYTRIINFQNNTTKDYLNELTRLEQKQEINGIILDLRSNPGGLLSQAVSIADIFINEGLIVYTKGRTEEQNMVFKAKTTNPLSETPLLVLVNEGSASASEIVAGAIQDHERGIVLGTKTFGKGSVQTIIPLQDGAGLRMTTARYYTPSGRSIQATGIIPDIEVAYIPISKNGNGDQKNQNQPREASLKNHFKNESNKQKNEEALLNDGNGENSISKEAITRLSKDNQLQTALHILKGIALLAKDKSPVTH